MISEARYSVDDALILLSRGEGDLPSLAIEGGGDAGAKRLAEEFDASSSLQVLDLSRNEIHVDGATSICDSLADSMALHTLVLSCNPLGDDGLAAVAALTGRSKSLTYLDVSSCSVTGVGAERLSVSLLMNSESSLDTLKIGDNLLGDYGALAIARCITNHGTLRSVGLQSNHIEEIGTAALIQAAISNSWRLNTLDITSNQVGERGLELLNDLGVFKEGFKLVSDVTVPLPTTEFPYDAALGEDSKSRDLSLSEENDSDSNYDTDYDGDNHIKWGALVDDLADSLRDVQEVPPAEGEVGYASPVMYNRPPGDIVIQLEMLIRVLRHSIQPCGVADDDDGGEEAVVPMPPVLSHFYDCVSLLGDHLMSPPTTQETDSSMYFSHTFYNTAGLINPRCGVIRIKIVELFAAVLTLQYALVDEKIIEQEIIPIAVSMFFDYPWNNFLHSAIEILVEAVLKSPSLQLKFELIKNSHFLDRIFEAFDLYNAAGRYKVGYMGHLLNICNKMKEVALVDEAVSAFLLSNTKWKGFCNETLSKANSVQNTPLGGVDPPDRDEEVFKSVLKMSKMLKSMEELV